MKRKMLMAMAAGLSVVTFAAGEWDGESWYYDTSRHVADNPAQEASREATVDGKARGLAVSGEALADGLYRTCEESNEAKVRSQFRGLTVIVR